MNSPRQVPSANLWRRTWFHIGENCHLLNRPPRRASQTLQVAVQPRAVTTYASHTTQSTRARSSSNALITYSHKIPPSCYVELNLCHPHVEFGLQSSRASPAIFPSL